MTAKQKDLTEKYRQARNIFAGYEIRTDGGEWFKIERELRIYSPANIVTFELAEDLRYTCSPTQLIMSRRVSA